MEGRVGWDGVGPEAACAADPRSQLWALTSRGQ